MLPGTTVVFLAILIIALRVVDVVPASPVALALICNGRRGLRSLARPAGLSLPCKVAEIDDDTVGQRVKVSAAPDLGASTASERTIGKYVPRTEK